MLREKIIQEATRLFYLHGIKNVSMDELAYSLGISKRTLYENILSKEDLLRRCVLFSQEKRNRAMNEIIGRSENIIDGCLQIIDYYQRLRLPDIKFWEDLCKYYPGVYYSISIEERKNILNFKQLLKKGIRDNYFRKNIHIDEVATSFDVNSFIIFCNIYPTKESFFRNDIVYGVLVNMLRGMSTDKGMRIIDKYIADKPNTTN